MNRIDCIACDAHHAGQGMDSTIADAKEHGWHLLASTDVLGRPQWLCFSCVSEVRGPPPVIVEAAAHFCPVCGHQLAPDDVNIPSDAPVPTVEADCGNCGAECTVRVHVTDMRPAFDVPPE